MGVTADAGAQGSTPEPIACASSDSFANWLSQCGGSLAVSTYQAGKVGLVGWDGKRATLVLRQFDKPMGMATGPGGALAVATRHAVVLLADAPLLATDYRETERGKYDALYLPRAAYFTGDVNAHDLAYDGDGTLWLINSRFSCLSNLSREFSFTPRWKPPFVSEIVPEDRCHLNGLAMTNGRPKYVTCLGRTDSAGGWRPEKASGGVIVDVESNETIARGLSMPHSPRWHKGQLWVLNSGVGELWVVNPSTGQHVVVCALPAYLRGLCFVEKYAVIGMCQIRERHIFGGLPVQERHEKLLCGLAVVDLTTGEQVGTFEFTSGVTEVFEVQFLPGVRRPMILNVESEATRQAFTAPEFSYWLRPGNQLPNADERG